MHLTANAGSEGVNNVPDCCSSSTYSRWEGHTSSRKTSQGCQHRLLGGGYMHLTANAGGQVGDTCFMHLTANTGGQVGYLPATCTIRPTQAVRQLGGGPGMYVSVSRVLVLCLSWLRLSLRFRRWRWRGERARACVAYAQHLPCPARFSTDVRV